MKAGTNLVFGVAWAACFSSSPCVSQTINPKSLAGEWRTVAYFQCRPQKPRTYPGKLFVTQFKKGDECLSCEDLPGIISSRVYRLNNSGYYLRNYYATNDGRKLLLKSKKVITHHFTWSLQDSTLFIRSVSAGNYFYHQSHQEKEKEYIVSLDEEKLIVYHDQQVYVLMKYTGQKGPIKLPDYFIVPYVNQLIEAGLIKYQFLDDRGN